MVEVRAFSPDIAIADQVEADVLDVMPDGFEGEIQKTSENIPSKEEILNDVKWVRGFFIHEGFSISVRTDMISSLCDSGAMQYDLEHYEKYVVRIKRDLTQAPQVDETLYPPIPIVYGGNGVKPKINQKNDGIDNVLQKADRMEGLHIHLAQISALENSNPVEEVYLGRGMKICQWVENYAKNLEDENLKNNLLTLAHQRYNLFRIRLIEAFQRYVVHISKKFLERQPGLQYTDLINDGNLGVFQAVEKFDWRLGYRFSTYVTRWIRQAIGREITNTERSIRTPVHIEEWIRTYWKIYSRLGTELKRAPTLEEVLRAMKIIQDNMKPEQVTEIMKKYAWILESDARIGSLDGDDEDVNLHEIIKHPDVDVARAAEKDLLEQEMQEALGRLIEGKKINGNHKLVLELRHGLKGQDKHTLEEIAIILGKTRERVRQLEKEALKRLAKDPDFREQFSMYKDKPPKLKIT